MREGIIDRVVRVLKDEVRASVSSYFSPVRAVVNDMKRSVEQASRDARAADHPNSNEPPTRH